MFEKFYGYVDDDEEITKAQKLLQQGISYNASIVNFYGEDYYRINATFPYRRQPVNATLIINYNEVYRFMCSCDTHYFRNHYCEHFICLLECAEDYYHKNPISFTSKALKGLLSEYSNGNEQETAVMNRHVHLIPNISFEHSSLTVDYRIGEGKNYIIKNLEDFVNRMKSHESYSYGKNFAFNHREEYLDETSLSNYQLIKDYVDITHNFMSDYNNNYSYYSISVKRNIALSGTMLDRFFEINYGKNTTGLELKESVELKQVLIEENESGYEISVPNYYLIQGDKYSYLVYDQALYRVDASVNQISSLLNTFYSQGGKMLIDKKDMPSLYRSVVPALKKHFEVVSKFDAAIYEPVPDHFIFYLDANDETVTLEYILKYGEKAYRIDQYADSELRNLAKETRVGELINKYFTTEDHFTYVVKDNDTLFQLLSVGIDEFNAYGEVFASSKFKRLQVFKTPQVNIGVSLGSNLLHFDVNMEGVDLHEINDIINSYRQKKKYHRLRSGEFLMIDEQQFELLDEITNKSKKDLKALAEGNLDVPIYRSLYLDKILEESDVVYNPNQALVKLIQDFDQLDKKEEVPYNLQGELRPYQVEGYQWLKKLHHYGFGGILADDMGLGKTIQVITLLLSLQDEMTHPALIVTPASLVYNWENEIRRFGPDLNVLTMTGTQKERLGSLENYEQFDVLITSYDLLKRDITYYENKQFSVEVIDEAQFIKNANTLQSKAVKGIKAECKFALSGTPIENRLSELWSIFDYLMPGFLYSYSQFRAEFENPIVKGGNEEARNKLTKIVGPFILRRNKKDVLKDLPDKLEEVMYAKMDNKQEALYSAYVKRIKASLSGQSEQEFKENKIQVLKELTRLRQLCCDPSLFLEDYKGNSCKLDQCIDLVSTAIESNHKVLLFSQFTSMLEIIAHRLEEERIPYYMLTGATSKEERNKLVNAFNQNEIPIFLISLKAGGTGLNLTAADIVIHYDPWWNEAAMNQATDRAHRIGQVNTVTVYKMIVKDTLEEEILKLQESKAQLAKSILEGAATSLSSLSKNDLMEILK